MIGKSFLTYAGIISFLFTSLSQAELLKTKDIIPESKEDIMSQYLNRSDTVVLVCVYESRYTPVNNELGRLWHRAVQTRVIQSLRGNLAFSDRLVIKKVEEKFPEYGLLKKDGVLGYISSQENGEFWYVFIDSEKLKKNEDGSYEIALDTMWLNPLPMRLKNEVDSLNRLIRVEPAKIMEEADSAKYHSQKK